MTIEQLRHVYSAEPFRPFTLHLADGRALTVKHRESLAIVPSGRTVIVYQPDDSFSIVDLLSATDIEFKRNGKSPGRSAKNR